MALRPGALEAQAGGRIARGSAPLGLNENTDLAPPTATEGVTPAYCADRTSGTTSASDSNWTSGARSIASVGRASRLTDRPPSIDHRQLTTDLLVRRLWQTLDDALAELSKLFVPRLEAAVVAGGRRARWWRFTRPNNNSRPLPRAAEEGQLESAATTARRVLRHHADGDRIGGDFDGPTVVRPRQSIFVLAQRGRKRTARRFPSVSQRNEATDARARSRQKIVLLRRRRRAVCLQSLLRTDGRWADGWMRACALGGKYYQRSSRAYADL
uniref:Uncharacterized protein n=1 Tax=Plectus sambesii TaxID=2011161 RepID=A0A914W457_9BILA